VTLKAPVTLDPLVKLPVADLPVPPRVILQDHLAVTLLGHPVVDLQEATPTMILLTPRYPNPSPNLSPNLKSLIVSCEKQF